MNIGDFVVITNASRENWIPSGPSGYKEATPVYNPYHIGELGRIIDAEYIEKLSGREYRDTDVLLVSPKINELYIAIFQPREFELVDGNPERIKEFFKSLKERKVFNFDYQVDEAAERALDIYPILSEANLSVKYNKEILLMGDKKFAEDLANLENKIDKMKPIIESGIRF